jgi:hypothetical protein
LQYGSLLASVNDKKSFESAGWALFIALSSLRRTSIHGTGSSSGTTSSAKILSGTIPPENRHAFQARPQSGALDEVGLVLFENTPMRISHTMRHAASSDADELFIRRQVAGKLALEQGASSVPKLWNFLTLAPSRPGPGRP